MTIAVLPVLAGCGAALRPVKARVVLPRPCIVEVKLSDKSECRGPDMEHLRCTGITVEKIKGCEHVEVVH